MTNPNTDLQATHYEIPDEPEGSFANPSKRERAAAATRMALREAGIDTSETVGGAVQRADATNVSRSEGQQGVIPHFEDSEPKIRQFESRYPQ